MADVPRHLQFIAPSDCTLLPIRLRYTETLSADFTAELTVLFGDDQAEFQAMMSRPVSLLLTLPDQGQRYLHAVVGATKILDHDGVIELQLVLYPWTRLLRRVTRYRTFRDQSVLTIIKAVLRDAQLPCIHLETQDLTAHYPPSPFCVQYRETDWAFIQRLLADAGIYFTFRHETTHTVLVLNDDSRREPTQSYPYRSEGDKALHLSQHQAAAECVTNQVRVEHHQHGQSTQRVKRPAPHIQQILLREEYHSQIGPTDPESVERAATLRALRAEQTRLVHTFSSNILALNLDTHLNLTGPEAEEADLDQGIYLTQIVHELIDESGSTERQLNAIAKNATVHYHNTLTALPSVQRYAPPLKPAPYAAGWHKATVCGEPGNTPVDRLGRIQVQFDWSPKASDSDLRSNWLPVMQPQAHGRSGQQFLPRVGDHVWMEFVENNPDYPVVMASVVFRPPAQAPEITSIRTGDPSQPMGEHTQSVVFDDSPGSEAIRLTTPGDVVETVEKSEQRTVAQHAKHITHGDHTIHAKRVHLHATEQLQLQAGSGEIQLTPGEIRLQAPQIQLGPAGDVGTEALAPVATQAPETRLILQLVDNINQGQPDKPAALGPLFQDLVLTLGGIDNPQGNNQPSPIDTKGRWVIHRFTPNLAAIEVQLGYQGQAIGLSAINGEPILQDRPWCQYRLTSTHWRHTPPTRDKAGNVCYQVTLTVLPPLMLINLRQDAWAVRPNQEPDPLTQPLRSYFAPCEVTGWVTDSLPNWLLTYAEHQGNNVTFFIHGYNVKPGRMAQGEQGQWVAYDDPESGTQAEGAYHWLLAMESHLNQAAGFDGKDYSQYTRVIGITWQGNPNYPTDYMAAVPMATFAAEKLVTLIQQCRQRDIHVNVMAHSLGNAVLMQALTLCGQMGITVQHSFLWQAAIPSTAFEAAVSTPLPLVIGSQPVPYPRHYPLAQHGTEAVTVLYSDRDNILGPIPPMLSKPAVPAKTKQERLARTVLNHLTYQVAWLVFEVQDLIDDYRAWHASEAGQLWDYYAEKVFDEGAGLLFTLPSLIIHAADPVLQASLGTQPLESIYHVANRIGVPLSLLLDPKERAAYYERWVAHYGQYQVGTVTQAFAPSLTEQRAVFNRDYPTLFHQIAELIEDIEQVIQQGSNTDALNKLIRHIMDLIDPIVADNQVTRIVKTLISNRFRQPTAQDEANNLFHREDYKEEQRWLKLLNQLLTDDIKTHWRDIVTVILSALLTPEAKPVAAMGYNGASGNVADKMYKAKKLYPSDQKDPEGHDLCIDHCAMHYPSKAMMKWVFKKYLMGNDPWSFKQFGTWKT